MTKNHEWRRLANLDLAISITAMTVLIGITFFGVIMRYAFHAPLTWGEELSLGLILWVVFFAGGAAFRTGNHVAIDMVVNLMPNKLRTIIEVIVSIICVLILGYLVFYSCQFIMELYNTGRTTNILRIPYWQVYLCFPVSSILLIINFIISRLREFGVIAAAGGEANAN